MSLRVCRLDVMGRQMYLESAQPSFAPADSHGPDSVPRPATAPAYYLGQPAWVWISALRRAELHTKAKARIRADHREAIMVTFAWQGVPG